MYALNVLLAVFGIGLLMIVHEGGHYLAARWAKMRVLKFSIGFGPVLYRKQPKGSSTVFQIGVIPFLAYVQVAGMNPYEEVDPNDPGLFNQKSVLARIAVIAAGPIANYLAAALIIFGVALTGMPTARQVSPMTAREIQPGSAAAEAGVRVGDVFLEANGERVRTVEDLMRVTEPRAGEPTPYVLRRGSERLTVVMTPRDVGGAGRIGVTPPPGRVVYVPLPVAEAAKQALTVPAAMTMAQITGLADMFRRRSTDNLGGVVGIADQVARAAERGPADYLMFLALISSALAFFNLLPFPALDGGRLIFLAYEVVARRKVNEKFETVVHTAGLLFLLALMVFVTYRDIARMVAGPEASTPSQQSQPRD